MTISGNLSAKEERCGAGIDLSHREVRRRKDVATALSYPGNWMTSTPPFSVLTW